MTRCDGERPVNVTVAAAGSSAVSVDGAPARSGNFDAPVALAAGQRFSFSSHDAQGTTSHHVRCLPGTFPRFEASYNDAVQTDLFFVTPNLGGNHGKYGAIFDRHGVPLWWITTSDQPLDLRPLRNGNLGFFLFKPAPSAFAEFTLAGEMVRQTHTVGTPTDSHDYQEVGDGHRLLMSYKRREPVDVSAYTGKPADVDGIVSDAELQELDADGAVVWSWNSKDHIDLSETGRWWQRVPPTKTADGRDIYDIVHINSVEDDGDGLVVSMRHTDAIYRLRKSDGAITYKLGGSVDAREPDRRRRERRADRRTSSSAVSTTPASSPTAHSRCTTTRPA